MKFWVDRHVNLVNRAGLDRDLHLPVDLKFLAACLFILSPSLSVVGTEITILAHSMRIVCPLRMWALISQFLSAPWMVTIFTHTLSVESQACVWTLSYMFLLLVFLFLDASLAATRSFCRAPALWITRVRRLFRKSRLYDLLRGCILRHWGSAAVFSFRLHILKLVVHSSLMLMLLGVHRRLQRRRFRIIKNGKVLPIPFCTLLNYGNFMAFTLGFKLLIA